jgi:diguanylate cyclase (GGDEF)-like protein
MQRTTADGREHHFALLVLDIDRFKYVNDALGHAVGDRLLVEIGARLHRAVPDGHLVARLGGDEFAVVAPEVETAADARDLAGAISVMLSVPVVLDGLSLDVGGSIGIAMYPAHGDDFATLMRHADVAMYDAKMRGDAVAVYAPEADHNSADRLSLLADLRRALENPDSAEVAFYYQPQVEMASGLVVGVEALLRWHHPQRGLIDPEELIRVAEHSGVMRLLTLRVIDDVIAQLAKWRANGLVLRAAINVSVRDLHTGEIVDRLADRLAHHEIAAEMLQLEITEGALMADPRRVLTTLQRLHKVGIALSLDDFGTGYSSMQHLRRLPLAEVKIDRSFVLGMVHDSDDEAIVRSIIELAGALGLRVVAEGVEDDRTRRLLVAAGCHVAQGWFYARPMPADELAGWLARYRPPQQQMNQPPAE